MSIAAQVTSTIVPTTGRRIIPPMFHYTVNHRVCPAALCRKPIASFSSTEAESLPLYKGITIIHCLITFPGVCELVRAGYASGHVNTRVPPSGTPLRSPTSPPPSIHGNHIAICFIGKAINRRWANSATRLHTKFTGSVPQVPM